MKWRKILLPAVIASGASLLITSSSSVGSITIQYPVYEGQGFASNSHHLVRAGAAATHAKIQEHRSHWRDDDDEGMAACMIFMDDNHYLIEWLAYHYVRLPLRRLIVSVDPKSKTSPARILDRYHSRGLINVTILDDKDYLPETIIERLKNDEYHLYLKRQEYSISNCLKTLKMENRSWVAVIDTDEFVAPNNRADGQHRVVDRNQTVKYVLEHPPSTEAWQNLSEIPCHQMARLNMGVKDLPYRDDNESRVPLGFNGSKFMSYRFVYPQDKTNKKLPGKAIIDLSRIRIRNIKPIQANSHRPLKKSCKLSGIWVDYVNSPFMVYHYAGTFEQFSFRDDGRGVKSWERYEQLIKYDRHARRIDYSASDWLQVFVQQIGSVSLAKKLLAGIGGVEPFNVTDSG